MFSLIEAATRRYIGTSAHSDLHGVRLARASEFAPSFVTTRPCNVVGGQNLITGRLSP